MVRGNLGNFLDWWVILRSLIDARPVHTRGALAFENPDGSPLEPAQRAWFRVAHPLPDDVFWHQAAMAYASDNGIAFDVEGWRKHAAKAAEALEEARKRCDALAPEKPEA